MKPICYSTGKCEHRELTCPIKSRVDANCFAGRPSSEWSEQLLRQTETVGGRADGFKITEHVDAIKSTDGVPSECETPAFQPPAREPSCVHDSNQPAGACRICKDDGRVSTWMRAWDYWRKKE